MRAIVCGFVVIIVAGIVGCGGGGGGGAQPLSLVGTQSDLVGTWRVQGLGLPDDQMGVQTNGDVVVNSESPATRGGSVAKIGTWSPQGTLSLAGTWRSGGVDYSIIGTGTFQPGSRSLAVQASVTGSDGISLRGATILGDKIGDYDLPPPPPDFPTGGDDMEQPPPPPY
jgi:hypothetical protein